MSKREQLVAVEELLSVAKTCLYRIASSYHGALGNQTKNELAKADQSIAELMRLVGNARERYCEKAVERDRS